jgi:hypothetical protein
MKQTPKPKNESSMDEKSMDPKPAKQTSVGKQIILPMAMLVLAAVITVGFIAALRVVTGPTLVVTQTPTPSSPAPTPQPISVPEIPDDWLTYRNDEFGFELKYPQQYVDAEGRSCKVEQAFDPAYSLTNGFFNVTLLEKFPGIALDEFARISEEERWVDEVQISVAEPYKIDGIEFVNTYHVYQKGRNQHTVAIYVANNSKVLRFWYESWPAAPCWDGIIQQVLETIRF